MAQQNVVSQRQSGEKVGLEIVPIVQRSHITLTVVVIENVYYPGTQECILINCEYSCLPLRELHQVMVCKKKYIYMYVCMYVCMYIKFLYYYIIFTQIGILSEDFKNIKIL